MIDSNEMKQRLLDENPDLDAWQSERRHTFELAKIIQVARKQRQITQKQLAEQLGLKQPALSEIENVQVSPSWERAMTILESLGILMVLTDDPSAHFVSQKEITSYIEAGVNKGVQTALVAMSKTQSSVVPK